MKWLPTVSKSRRPPMALVRDDNARAEALVGLHEQLSAAEEDLCALELHAAVAVAGLLGDAAGIWRLDHDALDLAVFVNGTDDTTEFLRNAVGGRCPPDSEVMGQVVGNRE